MERTKTMRRVGVALVVATLIGVILPTSQGCVCTGHNLFPCYHEEEEEGTGTATTGTESATDSGGECKAGEDYCLCKRGECDSLSFECDNNNHCVPSGGDTDQVTDPGETRGSSSGSSTASGSSTSPDPTTTSDTDGKTSCQSKDDCMEGYCWKDDYVEGLPNPETDYSCQMECMPEGMDTPSNYCLDNQSCCNADLGVTCVQGYCLNTNGAVPTTPRPRK